MTQTISPHNALQMLQDGTAVLIDVREADEFKDEHIAYALSLPLSSLQESLKLLRIPKDQTILFQCFQGKRGQIACECTNGTSYCPNSVMNIEGGIDGWKAEGLPVIGAQSPSNTTKMSLFRQVQIIVGLLVALCVGLGMAGHTVAFGVAGVLGVALFMAGLTGWCGLAFALSKMPWNK